MAGRRRRVALVGASVATPHRRARAATRTLQPDHGPRLCSLLRRDLPLPEVAPTGRVVAAGPCPGPAFGWRAGPVHSVKPGRKTAWQAGAWLGRRPTPPSSRSVSSPHVRGGMLPTLNDCGGWGVKLAAFNPVPSCKARVGPAGRCSATSPRQWRAEGVTPWAGLLGLPLPNQALLKPDPSRRWVPSRWRLRLGLPCSTADVTRLRLAGPGRCGRRTEGIGMGAVDEGIGRKGGG